MLILVTGATGLIGTAIVARLLAQGHRVRAVARSAPRLTHPALDWVRLDLRAARKPQDWRAHLSGVDAVINCAGTLQQGPRDDVDAVHAEAAAALFLACEAAGVRRVVHFSAIGVNRETPSAFSRTKLAGEAALTARALDWVILRPSVVLGRPVYGASALMRGLAALPVLPVMPGTAPIQPVRLEDVVETAIFFSTPDAPARMALDLAGPERLSFEDVVDRYRVWLGHKPAQRVSMPAILARLVYGLGDLAGRLGWRPPIRTTARLEIARGGTGDPEPWQRLTGIAPRTLASALMEEPASVQERWFAQLYLLKPVLFVALMLFWIGSGIASLGPGFQTGLAMMAQAGVTDLAAPVVIAGGLADLIIGCAIAVRRTTRTALWAGIGVSLAYAVAGTALLPSLWADPMAPLLKIAPVVALMLVALAILEDR